MQVTVDSPNFSEAVIGDPLGGSSGGLWGKHWNGRWYKMSVNKEPVNASFPVSPALIKRTAFCGVFGRMECEQFAASLVRYAQSEGAWTPFSLDDWNQLQSGYANRENLQFFVELGFLIEQDGNYHYTVGFVMEVLAYQR